MKSFLKWLGLTTCVLVLSAVSYFAIGVALRDIPEVRLGTVHSSLSRESCVECHKPIADEWSKSFHYRSLSGPFWERIRIKRADRLFAMLRVPCVNCHAPANLLDLAENAHPVQRTDAVQLGVDCVSCHVSEQGIMGSGRSTVAPHEVIADERFQDASLSSTAICARCHAEAQANVVAEWQQTPFARKGITCLDCHMPKLQAPSVAGGPVRLRRSHRFLSDKNLEMLRQALDTSISVDDSGNATIRVTNIGAGHSFPAAGTNWFFVNVKVANDAGVVLDENERGFGTREWIPGYLNFWPFAIVTRIPYGESRQIDVDLPSEHGRISVELRYRDWFMVKNQDIVFATLTKAY